MSTSIDYTWSSNGVVLSNSSQLDAATAALLPGDIIECEIVLTDDDTGISQTQSTSVLLENRAPSTPTTTVTWSGNGSYPIPGDSLNCTANGSVDPDGESVSYTYSWTTNASSGPPAGQTVSGTFTSQSDRWTCSVVTTDGTATSNAGTDTVMILSTSGCGLTPCDTNLDLGNGHNIDMVLVPSGTAQPIVFSITNDFYLMTTEVTQGMFMELMPYSPTTINCTGGGCGTQYSEGPDKPAYYLSWHQVADFANQVTQRHNSVHGTNLQECYSCTYSGNYNVNCTEVIEPYSCTGYVLPTEAEWEYAARSGTAEDFWSPDGGGDFSSNGCTGTETIQDGVNNPLLSDYAWYCSSSPDIHDVGQLLPNGFGLYDMHGNLSEWTADSYGCLFPASYTDHFCDSNDPFAQSNTRVVRGGSTASQPIMMTTFWRQLGRGNASTLYQLRMGIRLALHP